MNKKDQEWANMQREIVKWLAGDNTGISSETMAFWLGWSVRRKGMGGSSHPHDPSDFNRCLGLLSVAPELRNELHRMSRLSGKWAILVAHWAVLEETFLKEAGLNWTKSKHAHETYRLMKSLID